VSLQRKILDLKLQAAMAARHATFWQHAIDVHGEDRATAFYLHLGLNHLPAKSFDYDGLQLSREPKVHEALQVKAIASAQDSAKERLTNLLLVIRNGLVEDALARLVKLSPATYHKLIVTVSDNDHDQLHDAVTTTFNDGRLLIATQRGIKQADDDDYDDELDQLTSITASRLANDVQARVTGAASRYALLGMTSTALITAVTSDARSASTAYVERAATGLANRTLNLGRSAEAARYDWQRIEYSALLDVNTCGPCLDADGQEASDESQLTPAPNPDCEGYDNCRCFWVYVQD
jgi:hypothetical protein